MNPIRETYLERAGLLGCLGPIALGGLLGAGVGYLLLPSVVDDVDGAQVIFTFLYLLVGFGGGGVLGFGVAFGLDKWVNREKKVKEEF